jgi:hypothetical protein
LCVHGSKVTKKLIYPSISQKNFAIEAPVPFNV